MSYIGNTVENQNYVPAIDYFNGNGSTTAFTLSRPVASVAAVQAVINNVPQNPGDAFTVSGSTITFTSAPPSGTNNIYVYYTSPNTQVVQPGQGTVYPASLSTGGPTWNTSGSLGLGVTPSAWVDYPGVVQMPGGALAGYTSGTYIEVVQNAYWNGSSYKYINTGYAAKYQQNLGQHQWYTAPSGTAGNTLSFTQSLNLNANGALALQGGNILANGVGITFPATQSASSNANTLDDYEEGTWTPTIYGSSTAGTTTYNTGSTYGRYVKIGQWVFVEASVVWTTSSGAAGSAIFGGLPFTVANFGNHFPTGSIGYYNYGTSAGWSNIFQSILLGPNSTVGYLYYSGNNSSSGTGASILNSGGGNIYFNTYYLAD